jgi:sulfur-carrier protein adenylyltransferase/sulfurtransferase
MNPIEQIVELAKWAPSGDNTQPWRFEIVDDSHLVVHGFDTRNDCVYDFLGRPSQISLGALLENICIAASGHFLRADIAYRDSDDEHPAFDVRFTREPDLRPDPLIDCIRDRCVQRRPYSTRPLTQLEKSELASSLGAGHRLLWVEGFKGRLAMAKILSQSGRLRLTIPEAYQVHRRIIQWRARYSEDRVPDKALGLDGATLFLMRWVMGSWKRVEFFNTFLGGTILPRIELDMLPALGCAAHFFIVANEKSSKLEDYLLAGRALQRFWLTATKLGLQLQPEMSPLIFHSYASSGITVSARKGSQDEAVKIAKALDRVLTGQAARTVFMGRIGSGKNPAARSTRLPLHQLLRTGEDKL